jgi:hypothetical protein
VEETVMEPIKIELEELHGRWFAYLWGKSSPILRPVPNNTRPAGRAEWTSIQAAVSELISWLGPISVVRETRRTCVGCGATVGKSPDDRVYFGIVGPFCTVDCRNRWCDGQPNGGHSEGAA